MVFSISLPSNARGTAVFRTPVQRQLQPIKPLSTSVRHDVTASVNFSGLRLHQFFRVSQPNTAMMGGLMVDRDHVKSNIIKWTPIIEKKILDYDKRPLQREFPQIDKVLRDFGLHDFVGIPPAIGQPPFYGIQLFPGLQVLFLGGQPPKTTYAALAFVALDILKSLEPASSVEEAIAQVQVTTERVSHQSRKNTTKRLKPTSWEPLNGIGFKAPSMQALHNQVYSKIFNGHLLFLGRNGAMQVVKLPSAFEILEMLRHDKEAQKAIHRQRPLSQSRQGLWGIPSNNAYFYGTVSHLIEAMRGRHKDRITPEGWHDIHTLLELIPFDYATHIREGRLKCLLNKTGALDNATVWENAGKQDRKVVSPIALPHSSASV